MSKANEKDEPAIGGARAGKGYLKAHHKEDPGAAALKARKRAIQEEQGAAADERHEDRLKAEAAADRKRAK